MRRSLLLNSAAGALNSALAPILALILLAPAEYGRFSIVYLVFAFGLSLQLSLVGEAWARSLDIPGLPLADRREYYGILGWVCLFLFTVAVVAGFFAFGAEPVQLLLAGLGVAGGVQRLGGRYLMVYHQRFTPVLISDVAGIVAFFLVVGIGFGLGIGNPLDTVLLAWALSSVGSAAVFGMPRIATFRALGQWFRVRWQFIRVLVLDSTMLDLGGIGTPLVLAGLLGKTNFGIYRGVSSVAVPVTLLLDPVRPSLAKTQPRVLFRPLLIGAITAMGAFLAISAYVVLVVILPALPIDLGTLSALTPFALGSAVYVFFFFIGYPYYIAYRVYARAREILIGRLIQTIFAIALPLIGFALDGLNGAIWGFAGTAVVSTIVSVGIVLSFVRRGITVASTDRSDEAALESPSGPMG